MQMQKETQNTTLLQKPIDVLRFKGVTSQKGKNVFRLQSRRSLSPFCLSLVSSPFGFHMQTQLCCLQFAYVTRISEVEGYFESYAAICRCEFCKVDRSFSQWKLPLSAKASFTSKTEIYIFWNYSHFYLLSKVNIHVLFNEYLLTLSPTLYCVCGQMN